MKLKNLKELLQMYKKYTVTGVAVFAAAAMLTTGCATTKTGDSAEGTTGATNETTDEDTNELVENTHASIERLVTKYLDCIISGDTDTLATITDELTDEDKAKIVSRATAYDSYENMVCYTKDGPEEDSYIVFLCFDIKLKDFLKVETLVPDIQCLYVTPKDDDGSRYIRYSNVEDDEELQAYVKQLEEDPEVKALYADMQSRYQEALETDEALRTFMEKVTTGSGSDDAEASDEQTEEAAAEETTEEQPEETQESVDTGEAQAQNRETRVKESVNVRSDATTDSDRIALAYQGDAITEIESYDNGWSKVEYNGQTGYVKTEFLE